MRYPIKTSTKEFCDTIATSIARYEKYRCWASKGEGRSEEPGGGCECILHPRDCLLHPSRRLRQQLRPPPPQKNWCYAKSLSWGNIFGGDCEHFQRFRKGVGGKGLATDKPPKRAQKVLQKFVPLLLSGHRKKGTENRPKSLAFEGFLHANPLCPPTPFRNFWHFQCNQLRKRIIWELIDSRELRNFRVTAHGKESEVAAAANLAK